MTRIYDTGKLLIALVVRSVLYLLNCDTRVLQACSTSLAHLARFPGPRLNGLMRGGTVLVLLGITALGAYSVGRQNTPSTVMTSPPVLAKPVGFSGPVESPAPFPATGMMPSAKAVSSNKPARSDDKRKVEVALTAAAIAAIIVQASRDQYHAGGRPCACPDDAMRNGRACGGRSAYSRPGGAAPLCYPSDVTTAMIDSYRQRQASR